MLVALQADHQIVASQDMTEVVAVEQPMKENHNHL